ncbi:MAG: PQQ-dependent sugar dehydrogenase [Gemmatimonadales bacterium]
MPRPAFVLLTLATTLISPRARLQLPLPTTPPPSCTRTSGLALPEGFCAIRVVTRLGALRHLTVATNGDLFVSLDNNGIVALRDTNGDGEADQRETFGDEGGTGLGFHGGYLYFSPDDRVIRWRWTPGALRPTSPPETIVEGLPTGGHTAKSLVFLGGDTMIVNIGSQTNSCQERDRSSRSPGHEPCTELERRAGLWRFSSTRPGQRSGDGTRYATGLRNALALAVNPADGALFAAPHGRDQLAQNWGFTDVQGAELPSEELVQVSMGDDFGWPYCYFDHQQGKLVLAPEYGGDGKAIGRCASKKSPLLGFPGHWAPMAMAFYTATQFPERYRGGLFVAFHGSWNRAPLPQEGYRITFVPMRAGRPSGAPITFATGQDGPNSLRASGVAVGPDGSLYIGSARNGTVWKVMAQPS